MALYKEKTTKEGVVVSYWVIQSLKLDRGEGRVLIDVVPYVSQEAKESGASPLISCKESVRVEDLIYPDEEYGKDILHYTQYFSPAVLEGKNVYTVAYNYLKAEIPAFEGATDC